MKKETEVFPAVRGRIASGVSMSFASAFFAAVSSLRFHAVFVSVALFLPAAAALADVPDFKFDPPLAGRASLVEDGFVLKRELGVLAIAPELKIPVELAAGRFE